MTSKSLRENRFFATRNVDFAATCALMGARVEPILARTVAGLDVLQLAHKRNQYPGLAPLFETTMAARLMAITYELNARGAHVALNDDFEDTAGLFREPLRKLLTEVTPPQRIPTWPEGFPLCAFDPRLTQTSIDEAPDLIEIPTTWSRALLNLAYTIAPTLTNLESGPNIFQAVTL